MPPHTYHLSPITYQHDTSHRLLLSNPPPSRITVKYHIIVVLSRYRELWVVRCELMKETFDSQSGFWLFDDMNHEADCLIVITPSMIPTIRPSVDDKPAHAFTHSQTWLEVVSLCQ